MRGEMPTICVLPGQRQMSGYDRLFPRNGGLAAAGSGRHEKGGPHDDKGIVEFKAYYLQDGEECVLHEVSRFVKKEGAGFIWTA